MLGAGFAFAAGEAAPAEPFPQPRVMAPRVEDVVAPGTGKFLIFTRERAEAGAGDFSAGLWEFVPDRPGDGVVKRVEFAASSWTGTLAVPPDLGIEGPARRLVLLQVDDSSRPRGIRRLLYRIDFRAWEVELLGDSPFSSVAGGNAERLLVAGEQGIVPYEVEADRVTPGAAPFKKLHSCRETGHWLIRQGEGQAAEVWTYRPASLEQIARLSWPEMLWQEDRYPVWTEARADGRAWAMVTVDEGPGFFGAPAAPVQGSLWLAREGEDNPRTWPVEFLARPGSGNPWLPSGIRLWFEGEDGDQMDGGAVSRRVPLPLKRGASQA